MLAIISSNAAQCVWCTKLRISERTVVDVGESFALQQLHDLLRYMGILLQAEVRLSRLKFALHVMC